MYNRMETVMQCASDLRAILERLDALDEGEAAVHVQWAIDLLEKADGAGLAGPEA